MGTVAFFMLPELGHLNPSFKLAKSLQREGHHVLYLGAEDYEENIRAQGLECVAAFQALMPKGFLTSTVFTKIDEEWLTDPDAFRHLIVDQTSIISRSGEIVDFVHRFQPDLFIVDVFLPAVALLLRQLGIQCIFLNPGFNSYDQYFEGELAALKRVPELVLCPQEFDLPQPAGRSRPRCYVEPSIDLDRTEPAFDWEKLSTDKPVIYCALGSQSNVYGDEGKTFFRILVDAMAEKDQWQLVLATGAALHPDEFERVPPNVLLVRHAPQLKMLKRAAMMITHGGFGTVKECVFFGVPMIVFPLRRDQPRNAARVVYHGLGVRGDISRVSVPIIHSLIEKVDRTPRFKVNVEEMGKRFRHIERSGRALRVIEKTLALLKEKSDRQGHPSPLHGETAGARG